MINKNEWLDKRKNGIGGSDIAAIMGLSSYQTPYQVWLNKLKPVENKDTEHTRRGRLLEDVVVKFWQEDTKKNIVQESCDPFLIYYHKKYPFLFGSPDRIYIDKKGKGILECKTTLMNIDPDDLPKHWFCQIQWYMGIVGLEFGEIAYMSNFFKTGRVKYNFVQEFFDKMVEYAIYFWEEHIIKKVPPQFFNSSDIESIYKKHVDGSIIEATQETYSVYQSLKAVREKIKPLEKEEENLKFILKSVIKDNESIKFGDINLATWKATNDREIFDEENFKNDHPELYNKYIKIVPGSRRFCIK